MIHRRQTLLGCQFDTNSIFSKGAGGAESKDKLGALGLEGLNVTGYTGERLGGNMILNSC